MNIKQEFMTEISPAHLRPWPRKNMVFYLDGLGHVSPIEKAMLLLLITNENIQTKMKAFMLFHRIHIC